MRWLKILLKNWYYRMKLRATLIPNEIWIENTNCCNANCVMCPRELLTRPLAFMTLEAFKKIIMDIAPYANKVKRLHLHNFGEPLLDKNLVEKIRIAKNNGFGYIYFVTNAFLLTSELTKGFIEAGLDEFKVSFYGTDKKTYETTMKGLDFDRTMRNLITFFRIRKELNSQKPKVILQYIPQKENLMRVSEFKSLFQEMLNFEIGDSFHIEALHNYGCGMKFVKVEGNPNSICDYPWKVMLILCDSSVGLCCLDFNGVYTIGSVQEESIIDIWNGKKMSAIRKDFKNLNYQKYPLCKKCERSHQL